MASKLGKFIRRQKAVLGTLDPFRAGRREKALQDLGARRQAAGLKELKFTERDRSGATQVHVTMSKKRGMGAAPFVVKRKKI